MSAVDLILSRPEVIISIAFVVVILLSALGLAIGPRYYRRWKKHQAQKAAKLAEQKAAKAAAKQAAAQKAAAQKKRQQAKGGKPQKQRQRPAAPDADTDAAEPEETAVAPAAAVATPAAVSAPASEATAEATAATAPVSADAAPATPAAESSPAPAAETSATAGLEDTMNSMQDILDSVFVDEEANSRFAVLMQNVDVSSADDLLVLTHQIAGELRAKDKPQA